MRRLVSVALILTVAALISPVPKLTAQGQTGTLAGTAKDQVGRVVPPNTTVNVLDSTGKIVQSTTAAADGSFSFSGLNPGNYTVQLVSSGGHLIGATPAVAVTAAATTTVAVTASLAAVAVAAGGISTTILIASLGVGLAATIAVVSVVRDDASPSR